MAVRTGQNLLLAAVVLGLVAALVNMAAGVLDRRVWAAFALAWLVIGYVHWRQRRYLKGLSAERQ